MVEPQAGEASGGSDASRTNGGSPRVNKTTRKRPFKQALAACNPCRRAKKSCDNERPACSRCRRMRLACEYDTESRDESRSQAVKRQYGDLQLIHGSVNDSLEWLRSQPPDKVLSCIQRLADADDPSKELCFIVAAERAQAFPAAMPNANAAPAATWPYMRSQILLSFVHDYPKAYCRLSDNGSHLSRESRKSPITSPRQLASPKSPSLSSHEINTPKGMISSETHLRDSFARELVSDLQKVDIGFWTTVPIPHQLAVNLLSSYMSIEHPNYGFFDARLFVGSLLKRNFRFCSPLLVNAILFWTSCTFAPKFPEASAFTASLLRSAQMLLEGERSHDSPLAVASMMILTLGMICYGGDELAEKYMIDGIKMGERLHLIGEQRHDKEHFRSWSAEEMSMLRFVAWGAFNMSTIYTLHFHNLYSGTFTKCPPLLPLPTSSASPIGGRVVAGQTPPVSPSPDSFACFCRVWCIAHEIAAVLYAQPGPIHEHVPFAFAEAKFRDLLDWVKSIPPELARADDMSHNIAEMYICYHATVMDLFRPFLSGKNTLHNISAEPHRPEEIYIMSLHQLQSLVHYYDHSFASRAESHTVSWIHGPLYVASAIVHLPEYDSQKAEFSACMQTCTSLLQSHQVVEIFLKALFCMAIDKGTLTKEEASSQLAALTAKRKTPVPAATGPAAVAAPSPPEVASRVVVNQDLAMRDPDAAVGNALSRRLDDMTLFDEFLEMEV